MRGKHKQKVNTSVAYRPYAPANDKSISTKWGNTVGRLKSYWISIRCVKETP
jgi:hypothetical protein